MTEAALSSKLRGYATNVHWTRIENSVGVGCPDMFGCWKGKAFWLELKITGGARTRPSQAVWHLRNHLQGGRCFRLTYNPKNKLLIVDCIDAHGDWNKVDSFLLNQPNFAMFIASL